MKDYLDDPLLYEDVYDIKTRERYVVKIEGQALGWTYQGAIRLHGHYSAIQKGNTSEQDWQHLQFLIYRLKQAIIFYEKNPKYIQKDNDSN